MAIIIRSFKGKVYEKLAKYLPANKMICFDQIR